MLSIAQMPAGVPVGTLAIGRAGAVNAALLAAAIVALEDEKLRERSRTSAPRRRSAVLEHPDPRVGLDTTRARRDHRWRSARPHARARPARTSASRSRRCDPAERSPAAQVGPAIVGAYDDPDALSALAERSDVITYEFENVPVDGVRRARRARAPCGRRPACARRSARTAWPRRQLLRDARASRCRVYAAVDDRRRRCGRRSSASACRRCSRRGASATTARARRSIRERARRRTAWRALGEVPADPRGARAVRRASSRSSPCAPPTARSGSGRWSRTITRTASCACRSRRRRDVRRVAPASGRGSRAARCWNAWTTSACSRSSCSEGDGELLANEMAPRVHNSGHWTIEGAETSQFENHLRAIPGLPLGMTDVRGVSAMVNLIGTLPDPGAVLGYQARTSTSTARTRAGAEARTRHAPLRVMTRNPCRPNSSGFGAWGRCLSRGLPDLPRLHDAEPRR